MMVVAIAALSPAGCAFVFPGTTTLTEDPASRHLRFIPAGAPRSLPPVPAEKVRVVMVPYGGGDHVLAEGLTIDGLVIKARDDVPSADAPHLVLGDVRLDFLKRDAPEDATKVMAAEAGRHGANTLYVVDIDGSHWPGETRRVDRRAVAVRLSDATP